jgi:hypothetical protein
MATVQDRLPTLVKESEPLITGPESARRLIVVAVGWILLAKATPAVLEFAAGFVHGLTKGASQLPPTLHQLLGAVDLFGFAIVLLYAVSIKGRIVGGGDRRLGLGVARIARLPIIIGLSTILIDIQRLYILRYINTVPICSYNLPHSPRGSHYLTVC